MTDPDNLILRLLQDMRADIGTLRGELADMRHETAKSVYQDALIIDAYEHRTLMNFETFFSVSVWFACFPPDEAHTCHLFLNRSLAGLPVSRRNGRDSLKVPLSQTRLADDRRDFLAALMAAISLR